MSYEVSWIAEAEQELAAAWLTFPDRNAVTRAANELDKQLRDDPLHTGESRQSSNRRIAFRSRV